MQLIPLLWLLHTYNMLQTLKLRITKIHILQQVVPKTELPAISLQTCLKEIQVMNRMDIKVVSGTSSEHFFTITCNKCFKRTGSSSTLECVPCNVTEQEIEQGN